MRSSAAFYIFEAKLKQKKVDCKFFCNEKMLNATLFTVKKCGEVEYSGISDNFFDMKNVLNDFFDCFLSGEQSVFL